MPWINGMLGVILERCWYDWQTNRCESLSTYVDHMCSIHTQSETKHELATAAEWLIEWQKDIK